VPLGAQKFRMNTFPETDVNSLDSKDREQIISMVSQLLKGNNPGILSTIDQSGFPQSRWMATMSFDDFPNLYTLTAANSRKVGQIMEHPIVQWMFSNHDLSFIVNLTGRAEVFLRDAETMKHVWKQITDKSGAFFLSGEGSGFAVLHTKVEMIECSIPRKTIRFLIEPGELSSGCGTVENVAAGGSSP
jgi:general stress protein 26